MQKNIKNHSLPAERMEALLRGIVAYIIQNSNELLEAQEKLKKMKFTHEELIILGFPESSKENKIILLHKGTTSMESKEMDNNRTSLIYAEDHQSDKETQTSIESQNGVILTTHSRQRMKERCGLQKKSKARIAERVFEEGITPEETNGSLRKWITAVFCKNTEINNIRLYGDKVYLFAEKTLVTVLFIPKHFQVRVNQIAQKKKATRKDTLTTCPLNRMDL